MLWFGKKKKKPSDSPLSREELLAQAKANAQAARAEIGDETLEKIRDAMMKKENSEFEQARRKVKALDQDKVADHLKLMIEEGRGDKK